jgi:tRNA nucleotidyltransferase (CCA-adding enzyme)
MIKLIGEKYEKIHAIVEAIAQNNGRALIVGGAVRDMVMNLPIKDIDIEVYGLTEEQLEAILKQFGHVSLVGKSFGVLRIYGLDVDWSLPRADSAGRKPIVTIDPSMSVEMAAKRRDLTMNAISFDLLTQELIDPWGGVQDIHNKILKTPDKEFFVQDPLRFYRVMQFISRFEMMPDEELTSICKEMDIAHISRERIEEEFRKLLLLSKRPSLGIRWLKEIGRLREILPELADTIGIKQEPKWHPEGDVFEHSMQALDAAAIVVQKYDNEFDKLVMLYAALCHDLGKVTTSRMIDGVIKSYGHEKDSKKFARTMLKRITHNGDLIDAVSSLVLYHMMPLQFTKNKAKTAAYQRLANKLSLHVNMDMLIDLCISDKRGRNGESHQPLTTDFPDVKEFKEKTEQASVLYHGVEPLLKGSDVIDIVPAGPAMGKLLHDAYELQIAKGIKDKASLKEYLIKKIRK